MPFSTVTVGGAVPHLAKFPNTRALTLSPAHPFPSYKAGGRRSGTTSPVPIPIGHRTDRLTRRAQSQVETGAPRKSLLSGGPQWGPLPQGP